MKSIVAGALLAFFGFATSAHAALTITVPNVTLLANTPNQPVTIAVSGGDNVAGVNVFAQLGNGSALGVEPTFQQGSPASPDTSDFITNTIFSDTANHPGTKFDGTIIGFPMDTQPSYGLNKANDTVSAAGNFITLFINTTGLNGGTYALKLSGTEIGQDTHFLVAGGGVDQPVIINGSVSIPEPTSMLGLFAGGLLLVRRRRAA